MLILSVESTCDETAVAVTENGRKVLTDQIFSQADLHAVYGGVVPEIASRSHVEVISRLADRAIAAAGVKKSELDAVAVSYAPGLIGAVLVGVNFAKSAAAALGIPLIPVHHIRRPHPPRTTLPIRSLSRRSSVPPSPAATRCSWTCATIPIFAFSARRRDDAAGEML